MQEKTTASTKKNRNKKSSLPEELTIRGATIVKSQGFGA